MKLSDLVRADGINSERVMGTSQRVPVITINSSGDLTDLAEVTLRPLKEAGYLQLVSVTVTDREATVRFEGTVAQGLSPFFIFSGAKVLPQSVRIRGNTIRMAWPLGVEPNFDKESFCIVGRESIQIESDTVVVTQSVDYVETTGLSVLLELRLPVLGTTEPSDWVVQTAEGRVIAVASAEIEGSAVGLVLESVIEQGESFTVSYAGNTISGLSVFQRVPILNLSKFVSSVDSVAPVLIQSQRKQSIITLWFDQNIAVNSSQSISIVELDQNRLQLQPISVVAESNRVTVTLNKSAQYSDFILDYSSGLRSLLGSVAVSEFSVNFFAVPRVTKIEGRGSTVQITVDRPLQVQTLLRPEFFSLSVNQGTGRIESVEVRSREIRLELAGLGCFGLGLSCDDIALLSYRLPPFGKIRRTVEGDTYLEAFTGQRVQLSADPGPRVLSASIQGSQLSVEFDAQLSTEKPSIEGFTVQVDGRPVGIRSLQTQQSVLQLTVDKSALSYEEVTLNYKQPKTCCLNKLSSVFDIGVSTFFTEVRNETVPGDRVIAGLSCGGAGNDPSTLVTLYSDGTIALTHESEQCKCAVVERGCGLLGQNPTTSVLIWNTGRVDKFFQSEICGYVAPSVPELLPPLERTVIQEGCGLMRQSSSTYVVQWSDGLQDNLQRDSRCPQSGALPVTLGDTTVGAGAQQPQPQSGLGVDDPVRPRSAVPGITVPNQCGPCYGCVTVDGMIECSKCYGDCVPNQRSISTTPHFSCYQCSPSLFAQHDCTACRF
jgi:uncharacterized repeat protein (TIGR02059 family)